MTERKDEWQPDQVLEEEGWVRPLNPNDIAILSADAYERRAVDLHNRGFHEHALTAAILSLGARLEALK